MTSTPLSTPSTDAAVAPGPDARATVPLVVAALLYLVSGAAGLVYEVAFSRRLLLVLGSTAATSATVLAVYLAGLGAGGAWGGRRADRTARPLAFYGVLEIAAAGWAVAVLPGLAAVEGAYVRAAQSGGVARVLLDLLLVTAAVGPCAFLLGATFPAVLRAATPSGRAVGARAPFLYGVNTLGAVAGALWAGFFGIFDVGVSGVLRYAATAAALVGLVALALDRRPNALHAVPGDDAPTPPGPLLVAACSGFLALALEAAGVRIVVFFVEGFAASFAAMLGVFLAGLACGSLLLGPALARVARPARATGGLLFLVGVAVVGGLLALPAMEGVMRGVRDEAFSGADPRAAQRWCALAGSALLLAAPAVLLGAVYPLTVRWAADARPERLGAAAGRVALANGLGGVAGPLVVLMVGSVEASAATPGGPLLAWAGLGLLAGAVGLFLLAAGGGARRGVAVGGTLAGLLLGFGTPFLAARATPLDLIEASRVVRAADGRRDPARRVVAVRSDETTTASVVDAPPSDRTLYTDEFAAAATGAAYGYMRMLGHLPVFSAASPEHAMVIAFGTGTTAGAVAAHPDVRRLEVVETSRAVLALAPHFEHVNGRVLATDDAGRPADDRVRVRVDDGRRALLMHAPDLDVITLEPLMPYTPAALPFYTREFYELARSRLRDGGVLAQWIPVHAMPVDLYASLVRTFLEVFPDGALWFFEQSSVLIGRVGTARPDAATVVARGRDVQRMMRAAGFMRAPAVTLAWVASGPRIRAVLDDPSKSSEEAVRANPPGPLAARVVTDDLPFPEAYPLPRAGLATSYLSDTLLWLSGLVVPDDDPSASPALAFAPPEEFAVMHGQARTVLRARAVEALGDAYLLDAARIAAAAGRTGRGDLAAAAVRRRQQGFANLEDALSTYRELTAGPALGDLHLARRQGSLERRLLDGAARDALAALDAATAAGDASAAREAGERALALARRCVEVNSVDPNGTGQPEATALLGEALLRTGRCSEAEDVLQAARRAYPWLDRLRDLLLVTIEHRRGAAAAESPAAARLGAFAAALPRCTDGDVAAARPLLMRYRQADLEQRVDAMRQGAELLLALTKSDPSVTTSGLAREVAALPEPTGGTADAERAAFLRVLDPKAPRLPVLLADAYRERWKPALLAAAHWGFERTGVAEAVTTAFVRSTDRERRLAFAARVVGEGSRFALVAAVDLLADDDVEVRTTAWGALKARLPEAAVATIAYDPAAEPAARAEAAARARAALPPAR
ncbi:MAG: hypothetical protein JNM10_11740 [Planctomycetia bacterium]|nr:hypothetical protein [Planctomycetia bacterium]